MSYLAKLEHLCALLAQVTCTGDEVAFASQSGMVVSGEELSAESSVQFALSVEKQEIWQNNGNGVNNKKDYVEHEMKDTAKGRELKCVYEITMSRTVDGKTVDLTSVTKDTESAGSFRVTLTIPEEYRGREHYTLLHEHNGETVMLADLDQDPDTITVEIDRFSTFVLTATDETLGEAVEDKDTGFYGASLTLQSDLKMNYMVEKSMLAERGLVLDRVEFSFLDRRIVVEEYKESGAYYVFSLKNVAPFRMAEIVTAQLFVKDGDAEFAFEPMEYSVEQYCYNVLTHLKGDENAKMRTLAVDLLLYGAEAQRYKKYKLSDLAGAELKPEELAQRGDLPELVNHRKVENDLQNETVQIYGFSLNLSATINPSIYLLTDRTDNLEIRVYDVNGNLIESLSEESLSKSGSYWKGTFTTFHARRLRTPYYFTVYQNGVPVSDTVCYSIESYACDAEKTNDEALIRLTRAIMAYGASAIRYASK